MRLILNTRLYRERLLLLTVILLFVASNVAMAQEDPPRPISVTVIRNLSFGSFYQGASGGTVTINSAGVRSATGDVVLFSMGIPSTAIFDVVANLGTVISFLKPTTTLTDGSHNLTLHIGDSNPGSPFVTSLPYPTATQVIIGGSLDISTPAANPPGNYNGTFDITFIQE